MHLEIPLKSCASRVAISFRDTGFLYGGGVFHTTRTFGHKPFRLDDHVNRLFRSLKATGIDPGLTPEGAALIENPVNKAPGFQMDNVFVMAGIPAIMQTMFESLSHGLRTVFSPNQCLGEPRCRIELIPLLAQIRTESQPPLDYCLRFQPGHSARGDPFP